MKRSIFILFSILFVKPSSGEMEIVPKGIASFYDPEITVESPAFKEFTGILYRPYCYGKNNRGTNNPLDPKGFVVTTITINNVSYDLRYRSSIIKRGNKGKAGEVDFLINKGKKSFQSFCNVHPKICKRPLPYTDPRVGVALNSLQALLTNAFGGNINDALGQQYFSRTFGAMKSLYIEGSSNPAASFGAYEFVHFSNSTKEYCKAKGNINPCYKNRMCELTCALNTGYNSCLSECKGVVTGVDEDTVYCGIRRAKTNKQDTSGYKPTDSCEPNTIHFSVPEEIMPRTKAKVKHYQHNGKSGRPYQYYGFNGPMPDPKNVVIPSKKMAQIKAMFPGQDGFCGGFHSPLMVFFDNKRPSFNNVSKLLFEGDDGLTYWTEENHHGYYLAILDKGKGARKGIYRANQLFGDSDYYTGFEALERHDSNEDGKINSKDKNFSRLVLWKDKNGDSRSQEGEVISLKDSGIKEFNLKEVDDSYKFFFGERASARGRSLFSYKKDGKVFKGFLVDIYFSDFYY